MTRLSIATLTLVLFAAVAHAQTTTPPGTTPPPVTDPATGSFAKLSPGNQRIATAIYDSRKVTTPPPTGGTGGTTTGTTGTSGTGTTVTPAPKTLTLDQIAYMKLHDKMGWGNIYRDLYSRGLVTEKNLGQAMKTYNQKHPVTTASNTPTGTSSIGRDFMNGRGPGSSGGHGHGHVGGKPGGPGGGHGGGHGKR